MKKAVQLIILVLVLALTIGGMAWRLSSRPDKNSPYLGVWECSEVETNGLTLSADDAYGYRPRISFRQNGSAVFYMTADEKTEAKWKETEEGAVFYNLRSELLFAKAGDTLRYNAVGSGGKTATLIMVKILDN